MSTRSLAPAAPPRKNQRRPRREWATRDRRLRSHDFPIVDRRDGGRSYLLKGVSPDLWESFDQAVRAAGKNWRWTLLTLMQRVTERTITIEDTP